MKHHAAGDVDVAGCAFDVPGAIFDIAARTQDVVGSTWRHGSAMQHVLRATSIHGRRAFHEARAAFNDPPHSSHARPARVNVGANSLALFSLAVEKLDSGGTFSCRGEFIRPRRQGKGTPLISPAEGE